MQYGEKGRDAFTLLAELVSNKSNRVAMIYLIILISFIILAYSFVDFNRLALQLLELLECRSQ